MVDFGGICWAGIDRIIFFPVVVLAILLIYRQYFKIKQASKLLVHPSHQKTVLKNFSLLKQKIKVLLLSIGIVSLFIALLQPQWGKTEQTIAQEGRDLLIVLDISRSMQAKDIKPTRLDFAKLKIRSLLTKLTYERVGLVVFSGQAFIQCPLTADHAAFLMFLSHVDTEIIASGTTAIDKALEKTLQVYHQSDRKNKLVLLITDGEDFSLNLDATQQNAIKEQLNLFALGVGSSEGAPIPRFDNAGNQLGHETDEKGTIALSKLDEKKLDQLCSSLSGHYLKATYDDSDLDTLVSYINRYEKEKFSDQQLSLYEDQYPWFLGLAWICLALEWIL